MPRSVAKGLRSAANRFCPSAGANNRRMGEQMLPLACGSFLEGLPHLIAILLLSWEQVKYERT